MNTCHIWKVVAGVSLKTQFIMLPAKILGQHIYFYILALSIVSNHLQVHTGLKLHLVLVASHILEH